MDRCSIVIDMRVRQGEKCCGSMAPLKTQFEAHRTCLLSTQKSPVCGHSSFLPHLFPSAFVSLSRFFPSLALPRSCLLSQGSSGRGSPSSVGSVLRMGWFCFHASAVRVKVLLWKSFLMSLRLSSWLGHPVGFPPVSGVMSRSSLSEFCLVPPRLRYAQALSWFHRICFGCCWSPRDLPCSNTYSS